MRYNIQGKNNPNWKGGKSFVPYNCIVCGKIFNGYYSKNPKFCSIKCKAEFQKTLTREKSARWQGGIRKKKCEGCGKEIIWKSGDVYSIFLKQKFCNKKCADKFGFRYKGENHPSWKGGHTKRDKNKQRKWSAQVLKRDDYTCQNCGQRGGDLHAHHIKSFINNKKERWNINNGETLCISCHYKTYKFNGNQYTGKLAKGMNSGEVQKKLDNPDPSYYLKGNRRSND